MYSLTWLIIVLALALSIIIYATSCYHHRLKQLLVNPIKYENMQNKYAKWNDSDRYDPTSNLDRYYLHLPGRSTPLNKFFTGKTELDQQFISHIKENAFDNERWYDSINPAQRIVYDNPVMKTF